MPRSWRIDGSATFTTVLSSMIMNSPTETASSVHHLRFSSVKSRALISGGGLVCRLRHLGDLFLRLGRVRLQHEGAEQRARRGEGGQDVEGDREPVRERGP